MCLGRLGFLRRNHAQLREMADFCVLTPAPRTRVRVRGVVLQKSSHFRSLRLAHPLARPSGSRFARRSPPKASLSSVHLGGEESQICTFRHRSAYVIAAKISPPFFASKPLAPILNDPRRNTASSMRVTLFCALASLSCLRLVGLVTNRLVAHRSGSIFSAPPLCLTRARQGADHPKSSPVRLRASRQSV